MDLRKRLLAWMEGKEEDFGRMALEVFAYQFENNLPFRNYCEALERTPQSVTCWLEIPALPTDVFKLPDVGLRCFPEPEVGGFFLTSGTTQEVKGRHEWRDLTMYEAAVKGGWREMGLPEVKVPWFFSQRGVDAPHSSLVRMFETLDDGGEWLIDGDGRMDLGKFSPEGSCGVLGTSLALVRACEEMEPVKLEEGSWIFETGGSKGLRKSFSPEEVRARLSAHFGVSENRILNEYGMTELSSQFYKWGDEEAHKGPPWVGVRVVDVVTGELVKQGGIGYLEVVDLANFETVMAVRTQDFAVAIGEREFVLLGRDEGAVARGCSRGVEDVLEA
ncbi:MAG: hypothetical protein ACSHX7_14295, partial [Luteolibacter sp.]